MRATKRKWRSILPSGEPQWTGGTLWYKMSQKLTLKKSTLNLQSFLILTARWSKQLEKWCLICSRNNKGCHQVRSLRKDKSLSSLWRPIHSLISLKQNLVKLLYWLYCLFILDYFIKDLAQVMMCIYKVLFSLFKLWRFLIKKII